jgi:hypothetical protein
VTVPRILLFVPDLSWWYGASAKQQERTIRLLNGETNIRWPFPVPPVRVRGRDRERAHERLQLGLPVQAGVKGEVHEDRKIFVEHYRRIGQFYEWRTGVNLPSNIRRCGWCPNFFLVGNRPGRAFCSTNCGSYSRNRDAERRKLEQLKIAMQSIPANAPNWKARAARKARVTPNFITYAIRRGEMPNR